VLVLDDGVDLQLAKDLLYRRERWLVGRAISAQGVKWIKTLDEVWGLSACVYTALEANLQPRSPERMAELAIKSAAAPSGGSRRDGISYLEAQKLRGMATPMMPAYEAEVLRRTNAQNLAMAWQHVRSGAQPPS
jgi:hypothetical protein